MPPLKLTTYHRQGEHRMPRDAYRQKKPKKSTEEDDDRSEVSHASPYIHSLPASQAVKLCRKAGIKQQQTAVTHYVRSTLFAQLIETIVTDAVGLADYSENKTVQLRHIEKAVELRYGRRVY